MLVNIPVPSDFMSDFNFMDAEVRNSYLSLQKVLFLEEKQQHLLVYCPWNLVHVGWSISIKEIYFISGWTSLAFVLGFSSIPPTKINMSPEKGPFQKEVVFQSSFFRGTPRH